MGLSVLLKLIAKLIWIRSQALERGSFTAGSSRHAWAAGFSVLSALCAQQDSVCPMRLGALHILCVYTYFIYRRHELKSQTLQITSQLHVGTKMIFEKSVL